MSITARQQEREGKYAATIKELSEYLSPTLVEKAIRQGGVDKGTGRRSIPNAFKRISVSQRR